MTSTARITPSPRFLLAHPAHLVACGFGSGLSPFAPGTVGTLFAWASFPLLRQAIPELGLFLIFLSVAFTFGVLACDRTVGSSRVDLQACKLEYSIVSPK